MPGLRNVNRSRGLANVTADREKHPYPGASVRQAVNADGAPVPGNYFMTNIQSQTGTAADRFGGEKGFEDIVADLGGYPGAVVPAFENDGPRFFTITRCQNNYPILNRQGIDGVRDEVEDYLPEMGIIALYGRQLVCQCLPDNQAALLVLVLQNPQGGAYNLVHIHGFAVGLGLPGQPQQAGHDTAGPIQLPVREV